VKPLRRAFGIRLLAGAVAAAAVNPGLAAGAAAGGAPGSLRVLPEPGPGSTGSPRKAERLPAEPDPGPWSRRPGSLVLLQERRPQEAARDAAAPDSAGADSAAVAGVTRASDGRALAGVTIRFDPGGSTARSDSSGRFSLRVPAGTPGVMSLSKDGFALESVPVPALAAEERRELAIALVPLFTFDPVTVTTERERPLLDTRSAATGGAVERAELEGLPTDARSPLALAFNIPGVAQGTGFFGDAPPLTITGASALDTRYTLDGLDNDEGFLGGPRVEVPLSAVSRLSVHATTYEPRFGRSSSGVADVETRAGTGRWSGELFVFDRPGIPLDASPKFAPAGVDPDGFQRTQLGGTLSGPLAANRTFVFATAEFTSEREDRIGSTARTLFLGTEERDTWRLFGRLDHVWSAAQTTTLRAAFSDVSRAGQGGGVIVPEADITTRRIGSLTNLTHRMAFHRGEAANELSLQVGTFRWFFPPTASDLDTPQVTIVAPDLTTVEAVVGSSNFVFDESELQLQLKDLYEARLGSGHTLRLGADVVRSWFDLDAAGTNPRGAYTVVNDGDIRPSGRFVSIRDVPADVRVLRYTVDARPAEVDLTQTLVGAFVEDQWRITPALTVQAGLRWDYDDITSRGESEPDLDNLQPRISASWLVSPSAALRAGWGLYTGKFPYAVFSDAFQFGPEGNVTVTFEGERFPPPALGQGPSAEDLQGLVGELPPREIRRTFARGLEQPTSSQASVGYGLQFARDWAFSVDGVWVETRNLPRSWDLNAITRPLGPEDTEDRPPEFGDAFRPVRPEPGSFRRLTTTDSGGRARYLGLLTSLRRRFSAGLVVDASWTWSRARNDTEDINFNAAKGNDFDAEWADAVNDRRHHVTVRALHTPLDRLRLAWVADFQTGTPINRVAFFRDLDGSGAIFGNGFVGNHDRFFGVPRNGERLPGSFTLNGAVTYLHPLGAGDLELRVDAFNLLNSTNESGFANGIPGGGPRTQVGRPGDPVVITTAAPPRQFQLSARYVF
jgi:hypothetical protein